MHIRFHQLPAAILSLIAIPVSASVFYVDVNCTNPIPPYGSWSTAARQALRVSFDTNSSADANFYRVGVQQ